ARHDHVASVPAAGAGGALLGLGWPGSTHNRSLLMITRVVMAGLVTASRIYRLAALCVAQLGQARVACHPRLRCCTAFKTRIPATSAGMTITNRWCRCHTRLEQLFALTVALVRRKPPPARRGPWLTTFKSRANLEQSLDCRGASQISRHDRRCLGRPKSLSLRIVRAGAAQ